MASASSPRLKPMLDNGSGEGVMTARTAVLPPCAASAIGAPNQRGDQLFFWREL